MKNEIDILSNDIVDIISDHANNPNSSGLEFYVAGSSAVHLQVSIAMCMARMKTVEFCLVEDYSIQFSWYNDNNILTKLPFPLDANGVIALVFNWFNSLKTLPKEPNHDGSNSAGWEIESVRYDNTFKISYKWIVHHK